MKKLDKDTRRMMESNEVELPNSVGTVVIKNCPVEVANDIWNAAIDAAAKVIDDCNREGPYNAIGGARRIRNKLLNADSIERLINRLLKK